MAQPNKESPQERAANTSPTSPAEDTGKEKLNLKQPDAFGPVNIQENLRNPPEDKTPRPESAKKDDPLPAPGQTTPSRND